MNYKQIEQLVTSGNTPPETMSLSEQQCYICLQALYDRYCGGAISRDKVIAAKRMIRKALADAQYWEAQHCAAWAQYQEDIRQAGLLRAELCKTADPVKAALLATECVCKMCGEAVTLSTVKKNLGEKDE